MDWNEIVLDGHYWTAHNPQAIEAFFGPSGGDDSMAAATRRDFMNEFGLGEEEAPLLRFDPWNWDSPFRK